MDQNQQYLVEVLVRKITLELLNPLQNRIINLQQDFNNIDSSLNKQCQAIQIVNQQQQQRSLQDSIYLKNINEIRSNLSALEEKQTLVISTQNQTFTNLMDRIEHYSQQLNERSEKLKELQQQQMQMKTEQNFIQQTQSSNIDSIQKRINQIITENKEYNDNAKYNNEQQDAKMKDIMEKFQKFQNIAYQYSENFQKQQYLEKKMEYLSEQFDELRETTITKDQLEHKMKQENDYLTSELNTLNFKYQQQSSQNNRLISQVQIQIEEIQHGKEDLVTNVNSLQSEFFQVKEDLDMKVFEIEKLFGNIKASQETQYAAWDNTFENVKKSVELYKFDFGSMKQNFKKTLLKYEEIFDQYKEKCDSDITSILNRTTNNQVQLLEDKIAQIDTHLIEQIQSLQQQVTHNSQQPNLQNKHEISNAPQLQMRLEIPLGMSNEKQRKNSSQYPQDFTLTHIPQHANDNQKPQNQKIEYLTFSQKQSQSKIVDNSELIEIKSQLEKLQEEQKYVHTQHLQQEKELKSLGEKVKKQHERIEFFFLQTKTQLNKCTSKLDTIQSDSKQEFGNKTEYVDLDFIKKQIEYLQGQITKLRSDLQNDANFAQSQIKNLQKIRDQLLPQQQEQSTKLEALDESQKMMILVMLQNELVQLSHEDGLYKIDQQVNNLHFEFQPGQKDENTHITYRQQRISKVDFILNQILAIKKISMYLSRIEQSAMLSQSTTLRRSQTNRNKSLKNNSVISGKNAKLNESTRLTMRHTMTVEMNEKYMNRKKHNICNDSFKQTKICISNQKLYSTINDETF